MALPQRLVPLSLSKHLHPAVIRVRPASFLVTNFASPSLRHVFERHPVFLRLADYSIMTISPWAHGHGVLSATHGLNTTRDGLVCRILEAAVASPGEVGGNSTTDSSATIAVTTTSGGTGKSVPWDASANF